MSTSFPKNKIRVVLLEGIHQAGISRLEAEGFQVESLAGALSEDALVEKVREAHLLGIRSKTEVTPRVLAEAGRLLGVGCFCIGTNQVELRDAARRGVPVFNSPFSNTRSVAELTIAEVVALHRRLGEKSSQMHAGVWEKSSAGAHEVRGRTLGIVGYGHIGTQVSVLAEAMGMRVVYFDVISKMPMGNARAAKSLGEVLEQSDVVTLHVPATEATREMIGAPQLAKMKPGAFLINNARGSVVDIDALANAIRAGSLGGAAIDVFPEEPEGKSKEFRSPLCGLSNVILTPHVGGSTGEAQEAIAEDVAEKLLKFVNVGSTTGAVNVPEVELPAQPGAMGAAAGPRPHRILHFHRNVPGVLSKMHAAIAELGANISSEYLRTNEDVGYVVLDVDPVDGEKVLERVREIPETVRGPDAVVRGEGAEGQRGFSREGRDVCDDLLGLEVAPALSACVVLKNLIIDWYDQPLAGVLLLERVGEQVEMVYETLAQRFNSEGLDLRLAEVWEAPAGTIARLEGTESQSFCKAFFDAEDREAAWLNEDGELGPLKGRQGEAGCMTALNGAFRGPTALGRPETPHAFIAFASGSRVLKGWNARSGAAMTPELAGKLLRSVAFEP